MPGCTVGLGWGIAGNWITCLDLTQRSAKPDFPTLAAICSEQLQEEPCWDSGDVQLSPSWIWCDMSLSKGVHVCIFKLTCMCVSARAHVYIVSVLFVRWALCVHTRVYIYIYIYVWVCMCLCVCVCNCVCVCVRLFIYLLGRVYANITKGLSSTLTACVEFTDGGLGLDSRVCLLYMESG